MKLRVDTDDNIKFSKETLGGGDWRIFDDVPFIFIMQSDRFSSLENDWKRGKDMKENYETQMNSMRVYDEDAGWHSMYLFVGTFD